MEKKLTILIGAFLISLISFGGIKSENTETVLKDTESDSTQLLVGAAIRDITPTDEMFPLTRKVNVEMTGVLDPVHIRTIAISSGDVTTLIVSAETGRGPYGPQFAGAVAEHTGLPVEAVLLTATHAHAVPEITSQIDLYFEEGTEVTKLQLWGKYVMDQMLEAADEALENMKPASIGLGYSESYINTNRIVTYNKIAEDGTVSKSLGYGYNPKGVSDKELAAIRFNDEEGNPIAFMVNYAVHAVVMHGNTSIDGKTGVSGDIPGFVSRTLEEKYDGSVAVWLSGAAGDQNPLIANHVITPNPLTGEYEEKFSDSYEMLEFLSKIHFADIETALLGIKDFRSDLKVNYDFIKSYIPATDGGEYPISLQMLRIGDIALVGFPGELYNSVGLGIKENSILENTIVVANSWQKAYQSPGYYHDDLTIVKYGGRARYKPGYLKPELISMNNTLIHETNNWTFKNGVAKNKSTGETVIVGLDDRISTDDDNQIVNAAGKVLLKDVDVLYDNNASPYVQLGNGFKLYCGVDNKLGTTDDIVKGFGSFPQIDITGVEADPLNWRLLDIKNGKAIIACDKIVTPVKFNLNDGDGNEWAESNLRSWLNSNGGIDETGDIKGFYNIAFSNEEKAKIELTNVSMNSDAGFMAYNRLIQVMSEYKTYGTDTQDLVWALSGEEVFKYFGSSRIATEKETGRNPKYFSNANFKPSEYAHAKGVKINTGHNGPSFVGFGDAWTRSPGAETDREKFYGQFLGSQGNMNSGRPVTTVYGAIPVVTVNLEE